MPYRYLPDVAIADVAFEAEGADLASLFSSAADAALGVMVRDPAAIPLRERRPFEAEDAALDMLLFKLLEEIVYTKDADRLLLRCPAPVVRQSDGVWTLAAELSGAGLDEAGELLLDVKAVTLHMLQVQRSASGWTARVVLDI